MSSDSHQHPPDGKMPEHVEMPAPTVWPMVTAFGLTLLLAGLVTHWVVSLVGLLLSVRGGLGWFLEVMPHDHHEAIAVAPPEERSSPVMVAHAPVQHLVLGEGGHRVRVPAEYYPYSAGLKGGIAGGVVMAAMALLWGLVMKGSIWYPVNLLAATAVSSLTDAGAEQLLQFSALGLVVGLIIHIGMSLCIGFLYAVALPMFPKHAFWWAGVFTPLAWSAFAYATMPLLNPKLDELVNWPWFVACQLGFGLVCGYVVFHTEKAETMQTWPLMARVGLHGTHVISEEDHTSTKEGDKS